MLVTHLIKRRFKKLFVVICTTTFRNVFQNTGIWAEDKSTLHPFHQSDRCETALAEALHESNLHLIRGLLRALKMYRQCILLHQLMQVDKAEKLLGIPVFHQKLNVCQLAPANPLPLKVSCLRELLLYPELHCYLEWLQKPLRNPASPKGGS